MDSRLTFARWRSDAMSANQSNSDRGAALAWKVLFRVLPTLQISAMHENLEITIEIKPASATDGADGRQFYTIQEEQSGAKSASHQPKVGT